MFSTLLNSVEARDQPVREEYSYEAQRGQLHPPSLLCQHHVQLCKGDPQQEDSKQVKWHWLIGYSVKMGKYLGFTSTTVLVSWQKELEVLKCFQRNMEAPSLFPQWPGIFSIIQNEDPLWFKKHTKWIWFKMMCSEWKETLDASRSRLLALDNIKWIKETRWPMVTDHATIGRCLESNPWTNNGCGESWSSNKYCFRDHWLWSVFPTST